MLAKARSRSASETSSTWSKRASAFLTCEASVSGSFRCRGKAKTLSGRWLRSVSSPCRVCGCHVVLIVASSLVSHRRVVLLPLRDPAPGAWSGAGARRGHVVGQPQAHLAAHEL